LCGVPVYIHIVAHKIIFLEKGILREDFKCSKVQKVFMNVKYIN
jgi:hypothetical protein